MGGGPTSEAEFDVLTTTASQLSNLLAAGKTTTVQLAEIYLHEIEKHNGYLRAVIATAPRASLLEKAAVLDKERENGASRSKLHGIPILVKVELFMKATICRLVYEHV